MMLEHGVEERNRQDAKAGPLLTGSEKKYRNRKGRKGQTTDKILEGLAQRKRKEGSYIIFFIDNLFCQ